MIDWLNDNSGAVQGLAAIASVLVLLGLAAMTFWYAKRTGHMAEATRRQADASAEMVREMREQRLSEERPNLLLHVENADRLNWAFPHGAGSEDIYAMYPTALTCTVHNAGRAPAKELSLTLLHPHMGFQTVWKGYLLVNETWTPHPFVEAAPLAQALSGEEPVSLSAWLRKQGAEPNPVGDSYDAALVVAYRDIGGLPWATYLILGLSTRTDGRFLRDDTRYFTKRELVLHGQRRIPLSPEFAL
jgi:hypothetical protein